MSEKKTLIITGTTKEAAEIINQLIEQHGNIPIEILIDKYGKETLILA